MTSYENDDSYEDCRVWNIFFNDFLQDCDDSSSHEIDYFFFKLIITYLKIIIRITYNKLVIIIKNKKKSCKLQDFFMLLFKNLT